ncbi:MAG TPA: hypothetical protein VFZ53_17270 [Polyangiaceae bacterium]
MTMPVPSWWMALVLLVGCGEGHPPSPAERSPSPACRAPAGVTNEPRSIQQGVELVNALPKPLTLPCFVEALGRPLRLHAAISRVSAQPSRGTRSPRIFVYSETLVMTVVPEGRGAHLLEFGEQRPDLRSVKAELRFPIEENVSSSLPYEQALFTEEVTGCAFCHAGEEPDPSVIAAPAFVSVALRPLEQQRVPLSSLRDEHAICDAAIEPERCALLDALFGRGDVADWDFPPEMATFGQ